MMNRPQNSAVIVDVTVPFEAEEMFFENARREKLRKYHPLKEWLTSEGGLVNVSLHLS